MTQRTLRLAYWLSLALTIASLLSLTIIDQQLKTAVSPLGIVSFELCAFNASCSSIPASWAGEAKLYAAVSLGLDYLFMLVYPAAISCGLWLLSANAASSFKATAKFLIAAVWVAGFADAIENYHLFQMLMGQPIASHQWPATLAASLKFICLTPALLLWLYGGVSSVIRGKAHRVVAS